MGKRNNWQDFQLILEQHQIKKLYHFTDRENLQSIINNGGLYSWADCEEKGITIAKPGGGNPSRKLDKKHGLEHYVRLSFTKRHPMMFVAKDDGRINDPVILEINPEILYEEGTLFSDKNAASNDAHVGGTLDDFKKIHFKSVKASKHFDLEESEQPYFQAELLVKNFVPLSYITNIESFGILIKQPILDEETLTTEVTPVQFYAAVIEGYRDEYGALYSHDGKRLIKGPNTVTAYAIKLGTSIISDYAFDSCIKLQSITIPVGITHIGNAAFMGCRSLTSVSLPESLTHIGNQAFGWCRSLQSILIPEGITHIGKFAFHDCRSLQSVSLPQSITHIGKEAFRGCESLQLISLPKGLTQISDGTFSGCLSLKYISLSEGLIVIGERAFSWCTSLQSIFIPEGITHIGKEAFYGCTSLESISLPESITTIGHMAFFQCVIRSVTLPKSLCQTEGNPFAGCRKLQEVTSLSPHFVIQGSAVYSQNKKNLICYFGDEHYFSVPKDVTHIGIGAFALCTSIQFVYLSEGLTHIGDQAFGWCRSLQFVTMPESLIHIGNEAFYFCDSLQSVKLPYSITHIGDSAFSSCESLQFVILPYNLAQINKHAFSGCRSLVSIVLPSGLTDINDGAFSGCDSMKCINLPSSITHIGEDAFSGCESLQSITLPKGLLNIGKHAFLCRNLPRFVIPKGTRDKYESLLKEYLKFDRIEIDEKPDDALPF